MHHRILLGTTLLILATLMTTSTATAKRFIPHTSCTTSFPADGHPGPWRTTNNGGTLHGNTIHISCPGPTVHWDVEYNVQARTGGVWVDAFQFERSGNGTPNDFSGSVNPWQCDTLVYRTKIDNLVTGGTALKPSSGGVDPGC